MSEETEVYEATRLRLVPFAPSLHTTFFNIPFMDISSHHLPQICGLLRGLVLTFCFGILLSCFTVCVQWMRRMNFAHSEDFCISVDRAVTLERP